MANMDAQATVPVPSADLINYRFDQTDKRFEEMNQKLDKILLQNAHFLAEAEVKALITESLKPTNERLANYRWYFRAIFSAVALSLLTAILAYFVHHG